MALSNELQSAAGATQTSSNFSDTSDKKSELCARIEAQASEILDLANHYQANLVKSWSEFRTLHSIYLLRTTSLQESLNKVSDIYEAYVSTVSGDEGTCESELESCLRKLEVEAYCLRSLVKSGGASQITEILEYVLGADWAERLDSKLVGELKFYNSHFSPAEAEKAFLDIPSIGNREATLYDGEKVIYSQEELAVEAVSFTSPRIYPSVSVADQLRGSEMCIPFEQDGKLQLLIIRGHFRSDPSGLSSRLGPLRTKRRELESELRNAKIPDTFIQGWLSHYGMKEWTLLSPLELLEECKSAFSESQRAADQSLTDLALSFTSLSFPRKVRMLTLLLIAEKPGLGLQLMDGLRSESAELYQDLLCNLPVSLQTHFDQVQKSKNEEFEALRDALSSRSNIKEEIKHSLMPPEAKMQALEKQMEIEKSMMGEPKADTYLRRLLRFPWDKRKDLPVGLARSTGQEIRTFREQARTALNAAILGQDRAKEIVHGVTGRWISTNSTSGVCLGFEGSPGVGKTELAMAIARAWDMPVVYISCGGLSDGSFLKGHGYTYEGSQPGRIVSGLTSKGYENALFIIDEVDKLSDTAKGQEVAEALLELTDPNRNGRWEDNYFTDIPFPVSSSGIVMIYNEKKEIPQALWSRITNVKFENITDDEKLSIARDFMLPKVAKTCGFKSEEIQISDKAIIHLVKDFDAEPGVRKLEQRLLLVVTEANNRRLDDIDSFKMPFKINASFAREALIKTWSREDDGPRHYQAMYT